eukprot:scaffold2093_cov425-Prasinococcus_capsulatus_cf.AAC.6
MSRGAFHAMYVPSTIKIAFGKGGSCARATSCKSLISCAEAPMNAQLRTVALKTLIDIEPPTYPKARILLPIYDRPAGPDRFTPYQSACKPQSGAHVTFHTGPCPCAPRQPRGERARIIISSTWGSIHPAHPSGGSRRPPRAQRGDSGTTRRRGFIRGGAAAPTEPQCGTIGTSSWAGLHLLPVEWYRTSVACAIYRF